MVNICLLCLDSLSPCSVSVGVKEAHFWNPSWAVIELLSVTCWFFKPFFLPVSVPHKWTSLKILIPPYSSHPIAFICSYSSVLSLSGVSWLRRFKKKIIMKPVLLWEKGCNYLWNSCGEQTLSGPCWYPMSLCNPLPMSVGRTYDLFLRKAIRQSWWEVTSSIMLRKTVTSFLLKTFSIDSIHCWL